MTLRDWKIIDATGEEGVLVADASEADLDACEKRLCDPRVGRGDLAGKGHCAERIAIERLIRAKGWR